MNHYRWYYNAWYRIEWILKLITRTGFLKYASGLPIVTTNFSDLSDIQSASYILHCAIISNIGFSTKHLRLESFDTGTAALIIFYIFEISNECEILIDISTSACDTMPWLWFYFCLSIHFHFSLLRAFNLYIVLSSFPRTSGTDAHSSLSTGPKKRHVRFLKQGSNKIESYLYLKDLVSIGSPFSYPRSECLFRRRSRYIYSRNIPST